MELQRLRHEKRSGKLREDARQPHLARPMETAAIRNVRREVRDKHMVRVDRRILDDSRQIRWGRVQRCVGTDRRAHPHPSWNTGRVSGGRACRIFARKHQALDVSVICIYSEVLHLQHTGTRVKTMSKTVSCFRLHS